MIYTFNFTNRNYKEFSFKEVVLGIITVPFASPLKEIDRMANAYWKENGLKVDENEKNWGTFCLRRKGNDTAVTLFVFHGITKDMTGRVIDAAISDMSLWNGIEPTFDDYKRINIEFENQFID